MSDLRVWKGHFTGIQRVVYHVAKRYYESNEQVKFFVFNEQLNIFEVFDFGALDNAIKQAALNQGNEPALTSKQKIKHAAKAIYVKSPASVKRIIPARKVKAAGRKSLNAYSRLKSYTANKRYNASAKQQANTANFRTGDTVLILGNTWDRPELLLCMNKIREEKELKLYQVLYDMIPIFQPQAFNAELFKIYTRNMFEVVTNSDGLLAISESTKRDVQRFCDEMHVPCPEVEVIRLGDDIPVSGHPTEPAGLPHGEPFLLCVGTIEARKNHTLLYYAWKEGLRKGVNMPHLVIVGRPGWYTNDIIHTMRTDPDTRGRIHFMHNTSDDELVWLYQNALFTIYPSYYEGWGLPVAESAAMGKLCLSSNQSSMPEIAGDLMDYFSPYDSADCADKVIYYLDETKRKEKEEKLQKEYKVVSWDTTYEEVKSALNR